jgi:hypothetical protein
LLDNILTANAMIERSTEVPRLLRYLFVKNSTTALSSIILTSHETMIHRHGKKEEEIMVPGVPHNPLEFKASGEQVWKKEPVKKTTWSAYHSNRWGLSSSTRHRAKSVPG